MDWKSFSNGNGESPAYSSSLPKLWRTPAVADARAMSTTFWDLV